MQHTLIWHDVGDGEFQAGGLGFRFSIIPNINGKFSLRLQQGDSASRFCGLYPSLEAAKIAAADRVANA